MEFNPEKFKKFQQGGQQEQSLLALPTEEQRNVIPLRNRNPVIKDMESEILNMGSSWSDLTPQQKAQLRAQVNVR
jgi:hypothetical protein